MSPFSAPGTHLVAVAVDAPVHAPRPAMGGHRGQPQTENKPKFRVANLKVETIVFMLVALTFAAVLGRAAITKQDLLFTPQSGQYLIYTYGDENSAGNSTVITNPARPLTWSCLLKGGFAYPYCGYGLRLDGVKDGKGINFTHFQDITLRLKYTGVGDRVRLVFKNKLTPALQARIKDDDTMPMAVEFEVAQGENVIKLTRKQITTEQWWVANHKLTSDEAETRFDDITAFAFMSGSATPVGQFDVEVRDIEFSGTYLSPEQWYLIILGVWLVLTGAFLVYRFFAEKRGYEMRQRQQAHESQILAEARAAAEAASSAKSQFLAHMSHELRTPLNAILGYAQLLEDAGLTETQKAAITTIHQSGDHLLTMITDILDIAKVEAGKLEFVAASFDVRACVLSVTQMLRLRAEEKGLAFTLEIDDDVPSHVTADQKRIRQVLINLLTNAVKFTSTGEVRLEVSRASSEGDELNLRFDVVDTGVGISDDQIERIFRPFEQVGNAIDRSGGTGLGLSITQKIIEVMGGQIRVESTAGIGSRFIVEMPVESAATVPLLAAGEDVVPAEVHDTNVHTAMEAPKGEVLQHLLDLARAGNLRAIRNEIPAILAMGSQYRSFGERLDTLAADYQSPAVLRLIEHFAEERKAA